MHSVHTLDLSCVHGAARLRAVRSGHACTSRAGCRVVAPTTQYRRLSTDCVIGLAGRVASPVGRVAHTSCMYRRPHPGNDTKIVSQPRSSPLPYRSLGCVVSRHSQWPYLLPHYHDTINCIVTQFLQRPGLLMSRYN